MMPDALGEGRCSIFTTRFKPPEPRLYGPIDSYMQEPLAREIGLLRTIAKHLERRPESFERLTQEVLRREGLGHVHETKDGIMAIRIPGHLAFTELTDCLLGRLPAMERGAVYADIQTELFERIEAYAGIEPASIGSKDADALVAHFERWFASKASARRVFVPCLISRIPAPRFEIGPVTFEFIDRVTTSDFNPRGDDAILFTDMVKWMREQNADWLARVSVDGCALARAEEIAEIAVDLAIVALQLAAPYLDTRTMARLDERRGAAQKHTLSEANGYHHKGWGRREPGLAIGQGTLFDILQKAAVLFTAAGKVVHSFATGTFRLPALEQAWCDAAYWFHEALAEPLDTIAIAKLETALEILVCGESARGSEQRIREILSAFFDLEPDDPVFPGSSVSARKFAHNVVRDRSRVLHGTWSTLNARGIDRAGMESFVITVLRTSVVELERYATTSPDKPDDIDHFLSWVRQQK